MILKKNKFNKLWNVTTRQMVLEQQVIRGLLPVLGVILSSAIWILDRFNIVLADRDGVSLVGLVVRG